MNEFVLDIETTKNLDGELVCFNLFAPDAQKVELLLCNEKWLMDNSNGNWQVKTNAKDGDEYSFLINGELSVPDPLALMQKGDVHGASIVRKIPKALPAKALPWSESIIYELHIGTFTPEGTIKAAKRELCHLQELGVNTIELMPIAQSPGKFNWGYDGVLQFCADSKYGTPEDYIKFIDTAHELGMQVILDVVYNHFGPDGNYLYCYAYSKFFDKEIQTPWGNAINFADDFVREFYLKNISLWLGTYGFDGLRFDAVQEIKDKSEYHILEEILETTKAKFPDKHLILENLDNNATLLKKGYSAQWNDDFHHAIHVALTGENRQYYADYSQDFTNKPPAYFIGRTLCEGFAYQGEESYFENMNPRGTISKGLPPHKFINFIQNHDQVGNRPLGERLSMLLSPQEYKLAASLYLLCPSIPMIFMGEEWGAKTPFLYFTDLCEGLKKSINEGRKNEFKEFFNSKIEPPDPTEQDTFISSKLYWDDLEQEVYYDIFAFYKDLISLRKNKITPIIEKIFDAKYKIINDRALEAEWKFRGGKLILLLNLSSENIVSKYKKPIFSLYEGSYSINWYIEYE